MATIQEKRRAISWVRVSSEEQATEGRAGIARQRQAISLACQRWNLEICREYLVIDVSGPDVIRTTEFASLIENVKDQTIAGVVVEDFTRFCRIDDFASFIAYQPFLLHEKSLFTPSGEIRVAEDPGFIQAIFQGAFSRVERKAILARTHQAKEEKRKLGKCPSAKITLPQGIDYDRKDGKWVWEEPFSSRIRMAFEMLVDGEHNVSAIAKALKYECVRTLYGQLKNPIWTGIRAYTQKRGREKYLSKDGRQADRKKVPRENPLAVKIDIVPLISEEMFQQAQSILGGIRKSWVRSHSKKSRFAVTGLLWCKCGERMYSKGDVRAGKHDFYYCRSQHKGGIGCGAKKVWRENIDYTVGSFISDFFLNPVQLQKILDTVKLHKNDGEIKTKIESAQTEIDKLKEGKRRLLRLVVAHDFNESDVRQEARRIDSQICNWEYVLNKYRHDLAATALGNSKKAAEQIATVFAEFEFLNSDDRRRLLSRLISRITLTDGAIANIGVRIPGPVAKFGIRTDMDAQFGAKREIEITLEKPYRKEPPRHLNKLGIPEKIKYRTADVCSVLRITPDVLRWRSLKGKYPKVNRDGRGRIYTLEDIEMMLNNPPMLDEQRSKAGKRSRLRKKNR